MSPAILDQPARAATRPAWQTHAWRITLAGLLASCLAVWHISLLWLYRETPSVLGGWLMAVFALVVVLRGLARRVAPEQRSALMRAFARLDGTGFIFVAFLLTLLLLFHVSYERAASDGRSYFVQLRSLVMDHDLNLANDEATFGGNGANKYAFGAAVLWSPFYVAGHAWLHGANWMGGHWRADGYTYPYQRAIGLATLLYGFVGLVLIYRMLRHYFARNIATLSTLGICSTTFLIWYLTADNSMVHGVSMFGTALFLFLWNRFRQAPTSRRWLWLGASAGLMATLRWQDGVFMVLPVADLVWASWAARTGPPRDRALSAVRDLALFGLAALVVFSPQMMFWKAVYGSWIYLPTREHGFEPGFIPPYLLDVLFSSNRGLLSSSPVVFLSLIGLALFARRHWRVAVVLAAGFLGQVWVNGAVEIWWGGVGFGARRFANSMPVFALGLASLLVAVQQLPLVMPSLLLAGLLVYNVVYMTGFRNGTLSRGEGVTFEAIVGRFYQKVGNPFSLPAAACVAWRYDVDLVVYDLQRGRTYNNVAIDVGTQGDERFLGHGWAAREQAAEGSFRWADALTSTVLVPLTTNVDDYVLDLEWGSFAAPGLPPQVVTIELNDVKLQTLVVGPDIHSDRLTIPAQMLRRNRNLLRFRYTYATSPKQAGISSDDRPLAVRVSTIRFTRQLGQHAQR